MEAKQEKNFGNMVVESAEMNLFMEIIWKREYWDMQATVNTYIMLPDGTELKVVTSSDYSSLDKLQGMSNTVIEAEIVNLVNEALLWTYFRLRRIFKEIRSGNEDRYLAYEIKPG